MRDYRRELLEAHKDVGARRGESIADAVNRAAEEMRKITQILSPLLEDYTGPDYLSRLRAFAADVGRLQGDLEAKAPQETTENLDGPILSLCSARRKIGEPGAMRLILEGETAPVCVGQKYRLAKAK